MTQKHWSGRLVPMALGALALTTALSAQTPAPKGAARPATQPATKPSPKPAAKPAGRADTVGGMRRLTEEQYRNAIADVFGEDIQVAGRMDPIARAPHELQVVGVSRIAVSSVGVEEYARMAQAISAQVVDEAHRSTLVVCTPRDAKLADDECAAKFFLRTGRLLFRHPLSLKDVQTQVAAAAEAAKLTKDFYKGLALSLETMLTSPNFLFDVDEVERDPARPGMKRLNAYSKAMRLSLFLWNTPPDPALLEAAARGELNTPQGLARHVDRLLASPRVEAGVRAFFSDMLEFDRIADLAKDNVIYPQFNVDVKKDMPEQTLRTLVELLVRRNGDYRDVFTSREMYMTRSLGVVYGVPIGQARGWTLYKFPEDSPRSGLLTQMSFLATHSHDGRSSPTLRGKALRELVLCQPVPDPPNNVDFSLVNNTKNEKLRTVRDRLTVHRENRTCATCHRFMDPIGLSLENFDGVGAYRTQENGVTIDASGELDGTKFNDPVSLGQTVRNNPALAGCLTRRVSEYALRRPLGEGEVEWVKDLTSRFVRDGYRLRALLRQVATSDAFFAVSSGASTVVKEASSKTAAAVSSKAAKEVTQ